MDSQLWFLDLFFLAIHTSASFEPVLLCRAQVCEHVDALRFRMAAGPLPLSFLLQCQDEPAQLGHS